jgi:hypothetical protein
MGFAEISGINIKDCFASYFTSPQGPVPWQCEKLSSFQNLLNHKQFSELYMVIISEQLRLQNCSYTENVYTRNSVQ